MAGNKHSGRKPKADELALVEKLTPLTDKAFKELQKGIVWKAEADSRNKH